MALAAEHLRRLGHPLRLTLFALLRQRGELCVGAMATALGVQQATLSRHLRVLKDGRLVDSRRAGSNVFYAVDGETFAELSGKLGAILTDRSGNERSR